MDIKEIESLQNDSGLFNLDDIQTLFYEVSYYQDINEENIEKEKESKKESNSYAEKFNEYNRKLPGYVISIRNLEEELAKIDDKQQHLGGRISEKDKARKSLLLEQIDDLKKKYQEDKNNREKAKKSYTESKKINEQAKKTNEEAIAKQQLEVFQNKIVSIYKYCLSKNKEIDDKLAIMEFLINNETNMERKVKYSLEYYNLGKLKINIAENYKAVVDKIKGSEVYDNIKSSIEQAEIEVQNQQLEGFYDKEVRELQSGSRPIEEQVVENVEVPQEEVVEPVVENEKVPQEEVVEPVVENEEAPQEEVVEPVVKNEEAPQEVVEEPVVENEEAPQEEVVEPVVENEEAPQEEAEELPTITMPEFSFDNTNEKPTYDDVMKMMYPKVDNIGPTKEFTERPMTISEIAQNEGAIFKDEEHIDEKHDWMSYQNANNTGLTEDNLVEKEAKKVEEEKAKKGKSKKKHSLLGLFSLKNDKVENMIIDDPIDINAKPKQVVENVEQPQPEVVEQQPQPEVVEQQPQEEVVEQQPQEEVIEELPTITMPEFSFDEEQKDEEFPTITMPEFSFDEEQKEETPINNNVIEEEQNPFVQNIYSNSEVTEWDDKVAEKSNEPEEDNFMNPFDNFNYNTVNNEDEISKSEVKPEAILGEDEWTDTNEEPSLHEQIQSVVDYPIPSPQVTEEASSEDALDKFNSMFDNIDNSTNLKEIVPITISNIKDASMGLINNAKIKFQKMWFGENYDILKEQGRIR